MLLGQSFGEIVKISLQDFLDASVRGNGALAAATKQELSARLTALSPQLLQYDGILIAQGKRVGSQRGIYISTSAQKGEKHGQE